MDNCHREPIGLLIAIGVGGLNGASGMGLSFVHAEPLPNGKFKVPPEMEEAFKTGFRPVAVVKADPRNFLLGYELYLLEDLGLDAKEIEILKQLSILVMDAQMQEWTEAAMAKARTELQHE
jgi:hypothetical protein